MRFGPKDIVATACVFAVVVVYTAYVVFDGMPFVRDATGMAAIGLVLGFAGRRVGGREGFPNERAAFAAGLGSMAIGIAALVTESDVVLATFVASIVALWLAAMRVRAGAAAEALRR